MFTAVGVCMCVERRERCVWGDRTTDAAAPAAGPERVAISPLLATGRVHHHLVATQVRCPPAPRARGARARCAVWSLTGFG